MRTTRNILGWTLMALVALGGACTTEGIDTTQGGILDSDGDGIYAPADQCPDTTVPEQTVPASGRLNPNHFALGADGTFTKGSPRGRGRGVDATYTLADTAGCSCEQIVDALGAGKGHILHGCSPGIMEEWVASLPVTSCADLLRRDPEAESGIYPIDPDGAGGRESFEAYCDMDTEGGGWTLALVSSDDGQHTWTMNNIALMTTDPTPVGSPAQRDRDFKSPAWHDVAFSDLLFVHAPSGVTAVYGGVGDGGSSLGAFIDATPYPTCDLGLAGNGYPLTGGTLTLSGALCDTDLYFNLGDHELGEAYCRDLSSTWNGATMGPVWSTGNNNGCPFDDPAGAGLGPSNPLCGACSPSTGERETNARGFGRALGLNTGAAGAAENYLQIYVR